MKRTCIPAGDETVQVTRLVSEVEIKAARIDLLEHTRNAMRHEVADALGCELSAIAGVPITEKKRNGVVRLSLKIEGTRRIGGSR